MLVDLEDPVRRLDRHDLLFEAPLVDGLRSPCGATRSAHSSISSPAHPGPDGGVPAHGDRHVHVGRVGPVGVGGREPVDHLAVGPSLEPRRRRRGVHPAGDDQLVHAGADAGRCALHGGLACGAVAVVGKARHRRQPAGHRGMAGDDAAAVEALAEDDVVDRTRIEVGDGLATTCSASS